MRKWQGAREYQIGEGTGAKEEQKARDGWIMSEGSVATEGHEARDE